MKDYFKDIYFLPNNPALIEVNDIIQSSHVIIKTKTDFKDQLVMAIQGAMHENSDVKKYALKKLAQLLAEQEVAIFHLFAFVFCMHCFICLPSV